MKNKVVVFVLLVLLSSVILAQVESKDSSDKMIGEVSIIEIKAGLKDATNAWNESVIISPTWASIMGTFFGFNVKKVDTAVSVREVIILIMILIMFFVMIFDIVRIIPFFDKKLFGILPVPFITALIVSLLVSLTGTFISLKNLFLDGAQHLVDSLHWSWLDTALKHWWGGFVIGVVLMLILLVIHEAIDWLRPTLEKYAQKSKAVAAGDLQAAKNAQNAPVSPVV